MRHKIIKTIVSLFIILIFASTLALMEDGDFLDTLFYVLIVFFTGSYGGEITQEGSQLIIFISILGLIIELFLLVILITLLLRYIYTKQTNIRKFISLITFDIPLRQILLGFFVSISIISTVVFKI